MRKLLYGIAGVVLVTAAVASAVAFSRPTGHPDRHPPPSPSTRAAAPRTAYEETVDAANRHGLRVWIESDLVKRWEAGRDSFNEAVVMIAALARRPGVIGIKIADELGYHDELTSVQKVKAFLADSAAALRRAAPGKLLLADIIAPELGCLPGYEPPLRWATICSAQMRGQYPQLALDEVDSYLKSRSLDVVNLSTGLLPDKTYAGWGIDQDTAQRNAWQEVHRRGWDQFVRLQARKALAHPGTYTETNAEATLATFIDIPRASGAVAVDVWTWRQLYKGQVYRLMDPGMHRNALWDGLAKRRASGAALFTHLSPQSLEVGLDADLGVLAAVFTDLFVAAGTG
jgi:hypothetical protein